MESFTFINTVSLVGHIALRKEKMAALKSNDRCKDCKNCKIWSSDHKKASCKLNIRSQGFHPDSKVPSKCVRKNRRAY